MTAQKPKPVPAAKPASAPAASAAVAQPAPAPVVPPQYRVPRADVCMSEAMPFSQHWEARVPVALDEIKDMGDALQSAASSFRPGDQVVVCAFVSKDWRVLRAVSTYRVVGAGANQRVRLMPVGEPMLVPKELQADVTTDIPRLLVEPLGTGFVVKDDRGNHVEHFVERVQAEAFADRENARSRPANKAA